MTDAGLHKPTNFVSSDLTRYYARAESADGSWHGDYVDVTDEVAALRAERDEAVRVADMAHKNARWWKGQAEISESLLAEAKAERDELREQVDTKIDRLDTTLGVLRLIQQERDELRAALTDIERVTRSGAWMCDEHGCGADQIIDTVIDFTRAALTNEGAPE